MNGFPLRRVCQTYVIATSTRLDISTVKIPDTVNDDYFKRSSGQNKKKGGDIFADSKKVSTCVFLHNVKSLTFVYFKLYIRRVCDLCISRFLRSSFVTKVHFKLFLF